MTIIAFISQKGGVGKSTLARALTYEATKKGLTTLLADCDPQQATSYNWMLARKKSKIKVEIFPTAQAALKKASQYDLLIIDGPARTSHATLEIAQKADLIVQPTSTSIDDLEPAIKEFHALTKAGINKKKLVLVLNRVATEAEEEAARQYIKEADYHSFVASLKERSSYRQAQNEGKAITEVVYQSLKSQAEQLINEIIKKLNE